MDKEIREKRRVERKTKNAEKKEIYEQELQKIEAVMNDVYQKSIDKIDQAHIKQTEAYQKINRFFQKYVNQINIILVFFLFSTALFFVNIYIKIGNDYYNPISFFPLFFAYYLISNHPLRLFFRISKSHLVEFTFFERVKAKIKFFKTFLTRYPSLKFIFALFLIFQIINIYLLFYKLESQILYSYFDFPIIKILITNELLLYIAISNVYELINNTTMLFIYTIVLFYKGFK